MKSRKEIEKIYNRFVILPIFMGTGFLTLLIISSIVDCATKIETDMVMAYLSMLMCLMIGIVVGMKIMIMLIHDGKPDKISKTFGQNEVIVDDSSPIEPAR